MAEIALERLGDPVGVRLLAALPSGSESSSGAHALGEPAHDRVRERHRTLEPRAADELDRLVRGRVRRGVRVAELIRAEAQRSAHRRVELAHRPLAERVDRVVERAHALHGAVGEPLRERALALVEVARGGAKDAVGVRVLLEDAQQHLVRDAARRRDRHQRRPRRYSAYAMRRPPSGCTSSSSSAPSSPTRAFQTMSGGPSTTARAPMCGESARIRFDELVRGPREIELAVGGA